MKTVMQNAVDSGSGKAMAFGSLKFAKRKRYVRMPIAEDRLPHNIREMALV